MPEIALTTVGFIRTVTENRAPPRRAAATTSCPQYAESARTVTNPPPPQALAVTSASATIREAPRAELVGPRRNRVATTTGAEIAVDTIASNAFRPLTPLYPCPAPCLAYP